MAEFQSMRSSNKSRSRNKPGNNGQNSSNNNGGQRRPMGNIVNRVFESAGPDGKVRGTPQQIIDKYQALARDAQVAGDRVAAENYLQHSEHYSRLLGEAQRQQGEQRFGQERDDAPQGGEERFEPRGGDTRIQGAPREQGGQPPRPRPAPGFGLQTFEPEDGEFGPIPTPESGDPQLRLTAPAADYQPGETLSRDPRDETPAQPAVAERAPRPAPEPEPAPAPVVAVAAPEAPAPEPVSEAPAAVSEAVSEVPAEAPAEPVAEAPAPPKRTRTRRKKVEAPAEPAAEEAKPAADGTPEAQPAES